MVFLSVILSMCLFIQPALAGDVDIRLLHTELTTQIGIPAVIAPGGAWPVLEIAVQRAMTVEGRIIREDDKRIVETIPSRTLGPDDKTKISFDRMPARGRYRVQLRMQDADGAIAKEAFFFSVLDPTQVPANSSIAAYPGPDGRLLYTPDYRGNRIPDFSAVGYRSGQDIPNVPVKRTLSPEPGDATQRIQDAIDAVSELEPDANGFRGAVLLKQGVYEVASALTIRQSGVVLRGQGQGDFRRLWLDPAVDFSLERFTRAIAHRAATVLIATGPAQQRLIDIRGQSGASPITSTAAEIIDRYVPVGATTFHVDHPDAFNIGDAVIIERRSNADWITKIGMDAIPPRPDGGTVTQWSPFTLQYEHTIKSIEGRRIEIASSLVNAIEHQWGGGRILKYTDTGRIRQSGVENLRAISFWRKNKDGVDDTRHVAQFLMFHNIRDGWARNLTLEHFYSTSGAVTTGRGSLGITIENCSTLIADRAFYQGSGYDRTGRTFHETGVYVGRYGFHLTGQHGLVRHCYALNNRHAFVVGARVTGPNVFVRCVGADSLAYSEPHHRWSTGGLYDNVHDRIALMNRLRYGSGHGWSGANYVAWNTRGILVCEQPPTAQNWAIGHVGEKRAGPFADHGQPGYWQSQGRHVSPQSLYAQQYEERVAENLKTNTTD